MLYVVESDRHRVCALDPARFQLAAQKRCGEQSKDGALIFSFGGKGTGAGKLRDPFGEQRLVEMCAVACDACCLARIIEA